MIRKGEAPQHSGVPCLWRGNFSISENYNLPFPSINLTPQQFPAIIKLMNETENLKAKETVGELPQELRREPPKVLPKETPRASKIQKFYKVCGLVQTIIIGAIIISSLLVLYVSIRNNLIIEEINQLLMTQVLLSLLLISFLISILLVIIGASIYILYIINKTDKSRKVYSKKFMLRGIIVLLLTIIISFVTGVLMLSFPSSNL